MHEGKHELMHSKRIPEFVLKSAVQLSLQHSTEHQHQAENLKDEHYQTKKTEIKRGGKGKIKKMNCGAHFICSLGSRGDVCSTFS